MGPVSTTVGQITPVTLERYRIYELFAEFLNCSNMLVLNRPPEYDYLYDKQGRLRGGLAALEGLAQVISLNQGDRERESMELIQTKVESARELPVHGVSRSSPLFSSDDDMSSDDEPDEDAMEEIAMFDEPQSISLPRNHRQVERYHLLSWCTPVGAGRLLVESGNSLDRDCQSVRSLVSRWLTFYLGI